MSIKEASQQQQQSQSLKVANTQLQPKKRMKRLMGY